jgi:hypothetical protein
VELPDATAIFPYIGLFTLVTLNPTQVLRDMIITPFNPPLFIISGKNFVKAPSNLNTSLTSRNVARIFESLALYNDSPLKLGVIPISCDDQAFNENRYWRIPVQPAPIFAALIDRSFHYDSSGCEDIRLAKTIYHYLALQDIDGSDENNENINRDGGPSGGGGSGPNDDNDDNEREGGGPGPSRLGGGRASKRKRRL